MITPELADYIKQGRVRGMSDEDLKKSLRSAGWNDMQISEAFGSPSQSGIPTPPQPQTFLGPSSLLKGAWRIYKSRFWVLLLLGTPLFLDVIYSSLYPRQTGSGILDIFFTVLDIALVLVALWGQAAILYAIKDAQENIGVKESLKKARGKILSYVWVLILSTFIIAGGALLLFVPGVIFATWFSLALFVLVAENEKGMAALIKSKSYVKGNAWGIFYCLIAIGICIAFFSFIAGFIIQIVSGLILSGATLTLFNKIASSLITYLLSPLAFAYVYLMYSYLRGLKGGVAPSPKGRGWFIFIAILGLLVIPVIIGLILFSTLFVTWRSMIPFIAKVNSPQEQTSNSTTSTQSTETADWQTYTNNQYGFEMKYPAEWGNPKELADHELMFGDSFGVISQVYYGNNHQVLTIDDLAATKNSGYNKGDIIIDDIKGFEISSSQIGTVIYVPTSGQNIFTIEYDSPIHDQLLDEVLSTFKFISPTSQITSNEITIMTYGVRFITDNILVATEYVNGVSTSKEWTVNYKDAKYYEEYGQVLNGVVTWLQRPGDFGDWIQTRKLVSAPEYNGPGIPGVIKIVGTVDKDSTLQASKIIQHVQ